MSRVLQPGWPAGALRPAPVAQLVDETLQQGYYEAWAGRCTPDACPTEVLWCPAEGNGAAQRKDAPQRWLLSPPAVVCTRPVCTQAGNAAVGQCHMGMLLWANVTCCECFCGPTSHAAPAAGCSPAVQAQVSDAPRLQHVCLNNVQQAAQLGKHQHAVGRPCVTPRAG